MPPHNPRPRLAWQLRERTLALGERTLLMAIVNLTPDSFADDGQFDGPEHAIDRSLALLDEGADILDLGAESTRPGATPLTPEREQERLRPVLGALRAARPDAILSVDTFHASTAAMALELGADVINDVSGLRWDQAMAETLAGAPARPGVVLMHARGTPTTWADLPPLAPEAVPELVCRELAECLSHAVASGIPAECLVLDPGFGFGKRGAENYPLLAHLSDLHRLGRPLLGGLSRKRCRPYGCGAGRRAHPACPRCLSSPRGR